MSIWATSRHGGPGALHDSTMHAEPELRCVSEDVSRRRTDSGTDVADQSAQPAAEASADGRESSGVCSVAGHGREILLASFQGVSRKLRSEIDVERSKPCAEGGAHHRNSQTEESSSYTPDDGPFTGGCEHSTNRTSRK